MAFDGAHLTLVVYQLLQVNGQEEWREVDTYTAAIDVNVTLNQKIASWDWKWIIGLLFTPLIIPVIKKFIDAQKKSQTLPENTANSKKTKRKPNRKKG